MKFSSFLGLVLATSFGCSSGKNDSGSLDGTGSTGNGTGSTGNNAGAGNQGAGGLVFGVGGSGAGGGTTDPGNGTPEVCDGIDNNANGIIDDVDAGGDGVCDCLNIATIGEIGPWSNGGDIFATWLDSRSPIGATALGDQVITDDVLRPFQVVVILFASTEALDEKGNFRAAHHQFSAEETAAFERWVKAGGGVMTTIGYTSNEAAEGANVNRLIGGMGMGYSTTKLGVNGYVADWVQHPVTNGVSNIFTQNGAEPDGASATTLGHDGANRVALQVGEAGTGHIIVWGDEWITYDSEWADVTDQQVELFWLNMLKWLTPAKQCQVAIPPTLIH
jgi:hypothetical protein